MIQYKSLISKVWKMLSVELREGSFSLAFYKSIAFLLSCFFNDPFFALQQHLLEKSEKCYLYESDRWSNDSFSYHLL